LQSDVFLSELGPMHLKMQVTENQGFSFFRRSAGQCPNGQFQEGSDVPSRVVG
jgi:hypothetical protein